MDAWTDGYNACLAGIGRESNPWPTDEGAYTGWQHDSWNTGYDTALAGQLNK